MKELLYIPAQGTKTFDYKAAIEDIGFKWSFDVRGFFMVVKNEYDADYVDDVVSAINHYGINVELLEIPDDIVSLKKGVIASIKHNIKIYDNKIKKIDYEIDELHDKRKSNMQELSKYETLLTELNDPSYDIEAYLSKSFFKNIWD